MNQEIDNHFRGLLNSLENFIHSETVVGKPIVVGETTVIPLFRVSLGLGAGSGQKEDSQKDPEINSARKNHRKWKAFGSTKSHTIQTGSGAGATIVPYGVISVTKGETTVLPLARNSFEGIINLLPEVISRVKSETGETGPYDKNTETAVNNTRNKEDFYMPLATFKSTVELKEGVHCQATSRNFAVEMDEPPSLGGTDKAMNPVEMLLASLGGCLVISAQVFSAECGVQLKDVTVDLEGDLDTDGFLGKNPNVPAGFLDIRVNINLDTDSPKENVDLLVRTIEERCPVSDSLRRALPVKVTFNQT